MSIIDKFKEAIDLGNERAVRLYWRQVPTDKRQQHYDEMVAEVTRVAEQDRLDIPPFNDDLSKDEMVQHLLEFHAPVRGRSLSVANHMVSSNGTKATKEDLRRWHDAQHEADAVVRWEVLSNWDGDKGYYYPVVHIAGVPHQHSAIALNEEQSKVLAAVRSNQKVSGTTLGARDQKVLKELVDNDFGSLKAEMRAFAADTLTAKVADINAEWDRKEKSIPDFATRATEQHRKHAEKVRALQEKHRQEMDALTNSGKDAFDKIASEAKERGVVLKEEQESYVDAQGFGKKRTVFKAEVEGRKEAIAAATGENQKMLDRALMTVEKQRLTAQRQVLLSSVPDAALPIVESIPDAKTLMVEAQMIPAKEIESTTQS